MPLVLAFQAPPDSAAPPAGAATALVQRVEERPQSSLAQGSYAWPAWAVIVVAALAIVGAFAWWLRVQRPKSGSSASLGTEPATTAKRTRS